MGALAGLRLLHEIDRHCRLETGKRGGFIDVLDLLQSLEHATDDVGKLLPESLFIQDVLLQIRLEPLIERAKIMRLLFKILVEIRRKLLELRECPLHLIDCIAADGVVGNMAHVFLLRGIAEIFFPLAEPLQPPNHLIRGGTALEQGGELPPDGRQLPRVILPQNARLEALLDIRSVRDHHLILLGVPHICNSKEEMPERIVQKLAFSELLREIHLENIVCGAVRRVDLLLHHAHRIFGIRLACPFKCTGDIGGELRHVVELHDLIWMTCGDAVDIPVDKLSKAVRQHIPLIADAVRGVRAQLRACRRRDWTIERRIDVNPRLIGSRILLLILKEEDHLLVRRNPLDRAQHERRELMHTVNHNAVCIQMKIIRRPLRCPPQRLQQRRIDERLIEVAG